MNPSQSPENAGDEQARPDGPDDDAQASLDAAERELGALEGQLATAHEEVLRTRAEMDNLRKRLAREMDGARRYAGERILADLLPVADSLEQGLAAVTQAGPAREGLELTCRQLLSTLERHGVLAIEPAGQTFDPAEHQAVSTQPTAAHPENTVLTVLQKGYRLQDRLLRPALVIVASRPDPA
jgi:molecular chaperone GrpE